MPLTGLRVLDLSRLLPGPWCSLVLADLGADVIKVEDLVGGDYARWMLPLVDEYSAMFHQLNRNKRSVRLNLKAAEGRDAFLRLCDTADVVVESFRPGVMDRLGVGWAVLHARTPGLVLCSISGYGQTGPYRDRAGHDLNYTAVAGALGLSGTRDGIPAMPGVQVADLGGGAMSAAIAILVALRHRDRSGEGQHCDVAMVDGVVNWLSIPVAEVFAGDPVPRPGGAHLSGRHPCYNLYRCADGWMSVGALEPKFWTALTAALGLSHLATAHAAFAEGDEARRVVAEVEAVFLTDTRAGWGTRLRGHDVCVEPVLALDEALANEQVRARELVLPAGVAGPVEQLGFPFRLSATPQRVRRGAPGYGEHTREVLAEIGYAADAVDALVAGGAAA